MTKPTSDDIRARFIAFFEARAHTFVPSSPVVPHDDPTLLFANAGMNQYKPLFLGSVDPSSPLAGLKRAANSQKCIRAGGKHNDLEDVGKDTYHHTFFEMLGNWSFGDFFKEETIDWAWQFLTEECDIDPDRLYATYFGGDPDLGLEPDEEARSFWQRHLPDERILPFGMKDNFWEMGDTGPCGPCSEIHYDRIGGRDASIHVNADDPDVLEVWNLVFIQYDRQTAPGSKPGSPETILKPLPARHVDTGMGLERLTSVLQNVRSNYDTDTFAPIFEATERLTGARPYMGNVGDKDADRIDTAYRVIADHIRALTFAITDGAVPSNDGRGYVLRRILRRAVRYGRQMLNAPDGFFSKLVPVVVDKMGDAFPELKANPQRVEAIIRDEEESFGRTLDRGIKRFNEVVDKAIAFASCRTAPDFAEFQGVDYSALPEASERPGCFLARYSTTSGGSMSRTITPEHSLDVLAQLNVRVSGEDAFQLYDTYGFPLDLTILMAEERGLTVDVEGFERCMEEQRERSRAGGKTGDADAPMNIPAETIAKLESQNVEKTDDAPKFDAHDISARVEAIWDGNHLEFDADSSSGIRQFAIVLNKSNYYAESGGQIADHGDIVVSRADSRSGSLFRVEEVRAVGGYIFHIGRIRHGDIKVGDQVTLHVERARRRHIMANHTATHLMNFALREVLGDHVMQRGSLVAPDRLRFDFDNSGPVSPEDLAKVESIVRERIERDEPVHTGPAALNVARQITGVRAVFGEAYPDPVRVVSIGPSVDDLIANPEKPDWQSAPVEFCGGTHLASTGEAQAFAIVTEEGVAKGVRRIVALTGVPATAAIESGRNLEARLTTAAQNEPDDLAAELAEVGAEIDQLTIPVSHKAKLRKQLASLQDRVKAARKAHAAKGAAEAAAQAGKIADKAAMNSDKAVAANLGEGHDHGALQAAAKTIQSKCPDIPVLLLSPDPAEGKVLLLALVPDAAVKKGLKAGDWIRHVAPIVDGKGGGKPAMAQGAGTKIEAAEDAARAAHFFADKLLS